MQKKNNYLILSPNCLGSNIKPGFFSKHCELNKINKQKSFKIEETFTPKLFETKEQSTTPQSKLQKSQSANHLLLPKQLKKQRVERQEIQKVPSLQQDQITELSQKLYREVIEFNEQADCRGQNEIQQWSEEMIKRLLIIKTSLEQQDILDNQDIVNFSIFFQLLYNFQDNYQIIFEFAVTQFKISRMKLYRIYKRNYIKRRKKDTKLKKKRLIQLLNKSQKQINQKSNQESQKKSTQYDNLYKLCINKYEIQVLIITVQILRQETVFIQNICDFKQVNFFITSFWI